MLVTALAVFVRYDPIAAFAAGATAGLALGLLAACVIDDLLWERWYARQLCGGR